MVLDQSTPNDEAYNNYLKSGLFFCRTGELVSFSVSKPNETEQRKLSGYTYLFEMNTGVACALFVDAGKRVLCLLTT